MYCVSTRALFPPALDLPTAVGVSKLDGHRCLREWWLIWIPGVGLPLRGPTSARLSLHRFHFDGGSSKGYPAKEYAQAPNVCL